MASSDLPIDLVAGRADPAQRSPADDAARGAADVVRAETLGRLAAGLAHELKNPLGVLALGLAFLSKHPAADDPELIEVLADMRDAVMRANAAMTGLLEVATPHGPAPVRGPLEGPLAQALALARMQKCCAGVTLVEGERKGPTDVVVDPSLATQVLVNVLLDVVEETPPGGTVRVRTFALGPRPPDARGARRGWVACEVESLPPGDASPAEHGRGGAGERRVPGPQPGLASARRLLDRQRGWLRVTRGRGGGERVTVAYPAAE